MVCKAEQLFHIDNIPEESKIGIYSIHFYGLALTWHHALVQEEEGRDMLRIGRSIRYLSKNVLRRS